MSSAAVEKTIDDAVEVCLVGGMVSKTNYRSINS